MVSLTLALIIGAFLLVIVAWFKWQAYRAKQQALEFEQKNAKLAKQNEELQMQKAVAETQVTYYQTRKKNEENIDSTSRDQLLDRLQSNTDLRD